MTTYWYIQNDFTEKRSTRIGASDIPALIPNPEHPNESLAGYDRTAVTVWMEKTGRKEREPAGLPAEMGHWNEVKAIELFIRGIDPALSLQYLEDRQQFELLSTRMARGVHKPTNPDAYQSTPFKHNVQWYNDQFICHPDGLFDGGWRIKIDGAGNGWEPYIVNAHGYKIDHSQPYLIEAKNASFWAAKRHEGSLVSGYYFDLKTWQGIPLKHYVQIQAQLAWMDVDVCYLPLLYDSASFHVWEIKRDRTIGDQIIDLAGRMAWHIQHDEPPKELAMNALDIQQLYPQLNDDMTVLSGDKAAAAIEAARAKQHAEQQEKMWKAKKEDAIDALSVYLKDIKEIRAEINGEILTIAKWVENGGGERLIKGLKDLKKDNETEYRYLMRKGLIKTDAKGRYVKVSLKEDEE